MSSLDLAAASDHGRRRFSVALQWVAAICLSATACATGKEPPAPTKMVEFHDKVQFVFGMGALGCGMPQDVSACTQDGASMPESTPPMVVQLKPFAMDEHEVTNEQYRYCVQMEACSLPAGDNGPPGIVDAYYPSDKYAKYPVILVRWKQAVEYCAFVGKRLPTEFEWERVAGGPAQSAEGKFVYPWSNQAGYEPPLKTCPGKDVNIRRCNSGLNSTRPVKSSLDDVVVTESGSVFDLAGNVAEFTASDFDRKVGCDSAQAYTCDSCVSCLDKYKVIEKCKDTCLPCTCGDGPADTKPNCYRPCETPVCPKYKADAAPFDGSYTGKNSTTQRAVRGGSFFAESESWQDCDGRSDNRRLAQKPDDQPQAWIGFRCAKNL